MTRQVVPLYRSVLAPFVVLAALAAGSLTFRPTDTDELFAWTVEPPLTAALFGAFYGGTLVLFALTLRARAWVDVRLAVTAPLALSTALLVTTLLHLDRFHLDEGGLPAVIAWTWLVVYALVPPLLVTVLLVQRRVPGEDPPRTAPMPRPMRLVLAGLGSAALAGGAVLFAFPTQVGRHWPWALTPLTGQALASWMLGIGVAALHAAWEDDVHRVRAAPPALAVIGGLGLVAVARFRDDLDGGAGSVLVVAVLGALGLLGVVGTVVERRHGGTEGGEIPLV